MTYGVHWFRRDLRVAGNPALQWSWKRHEGRVVGLFCFDRKFLARDDFSPRRFAFFLETLEALREELRKIGSDLLVLDVGPREAFSELLAKLGHYGVEIPKTLSFNRDYEPFARERDSAMTRLFQEDHAIEVHTERDHLLIEPHEILKEDHSPYQVYTPFSRKWLALAKTEEIKNRVKVQRSGLLYLKKFEKGEINPELFRLTWKDLLGKNLAHLYPRDVLDHYRAECGKSIAPFPLPRAGSLEALKHLDQFKGSPLKHYGTLRDFPGTSGTSKLSIYLKNGSITSGQIVSELGLEPIDAPRDREPSELRFLKEIIWREFYYHILAHFPRVEKRPFQLGYESLKWENDPKLFEAWTQGMTGFPIVDAGMRQLLATGWMHNRVRMIVASFLTKDLLIDYRWGENHFMKYLLDGDLAPNNGGWQWAASTGCDPQPYFRIFNPWLQSKKFDPEGNYIRQWVPELRELSADEIHEPSVGKKAPHYPAPIVEHSIQSKKAIALFKESRQS
jgi:deoxyribodipyrimidine photo-lyase